MPADKRVKRLTEKHFKSRDLQRVHRYIHTLDGGERGTSEYDETGSILAWFVMLTSYALGLVLWVWWMCGDGLLGDGFKFFVGLGIWIYGSWYFAFFINRTLKRMADILYSPPSRGINLLIDPDGNPEMCFLGDYPALEGYYGYRLPNVHDLEKIEKYLACGQPYDDAAYSYHGNGLVESERFYKEGQRHREDDRPAWVSYRADGSVKWEEFYKEGKFHREGDRPAVVYYRADGSVAREESYKEGELHREGDRPARVWYRADGSVEQVWFYKKGLGVGAPHWRIDYDAKKGKLHREGDQPARVSYRADGSVEWEEFWKEGRSVAQPISMIS